MSIINHRSNTSLEKRAQSHLSTKQVLAALAVGMVQAVAPVDSLAGGLADGEVAARVARTQRVEGHVAVALVARDGRPVLHLQCRQVGPLLGARYLLILQQEWCCQAMVGLDLPRN